MFTGASRRITTELGEASLRAKSRDSSTGAAAKNRLPYGWRAVKALTVLAGDSDRAAAEITAEAGAAAWKAAGAPAPTRASATWGTSASSCATTRP